MFLNTADTSSQRKFISSVSKHQAFLHRKLINLSPDCKENYNRNDLKLIADMHLLAYCSVSVIFFHGSIFLVESTGFLISMMTKYQDLSMNPQVHHILRNNTKLVISERTGGRSLPSRRFGEG